MLRNIMFFLMLIQVVHFAAAQDMALDQVLIEDEPWQLLGEGYQFTEGPAADLKGNVFFTDVPNDRIYRIDTSGEITLFADETARTNGLMFGPDGRLYGCRNGNQQIVAYNDDDRFEVVADGVPSNDLVVDSRRNIYFTDPGNGKVWHIDPRGVKRVVAENLQPNGVILTPGEGTLVVTDAQQPVLWTFRVAADGSLQHRERYYQPLRMIPNARRTGSDGMAVDDDGRLYVATLAGLQMFDPTGRLGGVIGKPQEQFASNIVFGGEGFGYIYVTCTDKVYRRKVKPTGTPYFLRTRQKAQ